MTTRVFQNLRILLATVMTVSALCAAPAVAQDGPAPRHLTLEQAIVLALQHSAVLGATAARADAATAAHRQAGARPNPELSLEAENIFGNGPYNGTGNAELTYGVSQLVELPGKRSGRMQVADAERTKSHYSRDAARLDVIRDVTVAFAEVAAAAQDVAILDDEHALATAVRDSVTEKVQAGKEPPIQKNKAEIARAASQIALERARRLLAVKQQVLSSLTGGAADVSALESKSLPPLEAPQALDVYRRHLSETPDARMLDVDVAQARAGLSLEKANALPDPTLSLGLRDSREDDAQSVVAGVSFPLPVFHANRGGIERAGHDLNAAMLDQRSATLALSLALDAVYADVGSAYSEARALESMVLGGAEDAFAVAREGYNAGKFGYLDVLDAQRTLFSARRQFTAAVLEYQRQRATLERMTAFHAARFETEGQH